jgi:hypothetical protein
MTVEYTADRLGVAPYFNLGADRIHDGQVDVYKERGYVDVCELPAFYD